MANTYAEKLKDPRWQKKRLEILQRDNWTCLFCYDTKKSLHVHHIKYSYGNEPWEYENDNFLTLCHDCHELEFKYRKSVNDELDEVVKSNLSIYHSAVLSLLIQHQPKLVIEFINDGRNKMENK